MAHGGYGKRRAGGGNTKAANRKPKSLGVDRKPKTKSKPKPKSVSLKNQIRSTMRMLTKDLPPEIKEAQEKKLAGLKKQQVMHDRLAVERKMFLRNKKVKFFERRKIERRIRRLEKQLRSCPDPAQEADAAGQLAKLKEDLEYVRFFPKTEKYVPLFVAIDDPESLENRTKLRQQIKDKVVAAAASGKDLEETGSEDDGLLDLSDDDFFAGSSSDEADADDEWTDKSAKEQASSASGKAASGMSSDEKNQKQVSARTLMPPPRSQNKQISGPRNFKSSNGASSSKKPFIRRAEVSTSSNTSSSYNSSFRKRGPAESLTGNSDNLSSNSDARKPKRKRRPKKKKQQA